MQYKPEIYNRQSLRLKHYDYSQSGFYYVTLCIHQRKCILGNVINEQMVLNEAGEMIKKWWFKLEEKFQNHVILDEYVIMPNHFHGIILIDDKDLYEYLEQDVGQGGYVGKGGHAGPPLPPPVEALKLNVCKGEQRRLFLSEIIQWFKTMTTNEYIRGVKLGKFLRFERYLWQRNYYEHIVRNEKKLHNIREYIIGNPRNWKLDELYLLGTKPIAR